MSEVFRRVVLKPGGLAGDRLTQLAILLRAAVEAQKQIAGGSAHVLRLVGGLQETEHTFFVEHEPASPVCAKDLFNPGSPPADEKTLLRMAAALFDALRATHEMPGSLPTVHGGLCPGTLLIGDDGIEKVSDFGFAPALCAALGPEAYVNLAVGPRTQGQAEHLGTGVWEVLAPQVADRDDRICSFIDPEKYGTRLYHSFEPKSDIVAAGFILHLLAEHRHPYFHDDPEAHRMVEVGEYMAMSTGTRARRKELRESEEPAVKLWCELVVKMIDRLPQNRPSASELASKLSQYQRPVGPQEILQRRFDGLLNQLESVPLTELRWDVVATDAAGIRDSPEVPAPVRDLAGATVRLCQVVSSLRGPAWREAAKPLAELSATVHLPVGLSGKIAEAREILDRNLADQDAGLKAVSDRDQAMTALAEGDLPAARAAAEAALANAHIAPQVRAEVEQVLNELPALDRGQALMDSGEFPGAMEAFEVILQRKEPPLWPPVAAAVERLLGRVRQLRRKQMADSILGHLLQRAQREEESPPAAVLAPDESLPLSSPDWMRASLTDFETFLHGYAGAGQQMSPQEMLAVGERLGEKYEVLEFLGRGGMGEVYRARDLSLDREVALKLARPAAGGAGLVDALRNEAKAIAALDHPHIIHINSFEVIGDRPCFDTKYIRGRDLDQHARRRPLTWREMAETLIPIAQALAYAHRQGVLHRDVKPQNIYLGERPGEGPWLIDFGLARMRSMCDRRASVGLCGTPGYIAPEVITSMGEDVDQRADIFALGCVLYELLTRQAPFRRGGDSRGPGRHGSGPSVSRTLLNTLRARMSPLREAARDAPDALRRICERAMAHEPQDRYQDAEEVARDLRRFLVQFDRQEAEAAITRVRTRFAERATGEPAELEALQNVLAEAEAARNLTETARRRA